MFLQNNALIKWRNQLLGNFLMINDVKQGNVLSSSLFSFYIKPVINNITKTNLECHVESSAVSILFYTDNKKF